MSKKYIVMLVGALLVILAGVFFYLYSQNIKNTQDKSGGQNNQSAPQNGFSIIDDKQFMDSTNVESYKIGVAEFKIYPAIENPFTGGHFEVFNSGQKVFASEALYKIDGLLAFQLNENKYVIVRDYSGGAHCCDTDYLFMISGSGDIKLIKKFEMGNGSINKDSLIYKNEKLYLSLLDDSFSYFHVPFVASYFFNQYYRIDGDKIVLANDDFKDDLSKNAVSCKEQLNVDLQTAKNEFETWFPDMLCYVAGTTLAGNEKLASIDFDNYYAQFSGGKVLKDSFGVSLDQKKLKQEIFDTLHQDRFK